MKKRTFSSLFALLLVLFIVLVPNSSKDSTSVAYAENNLLSGIRIDREYIIPDSIDFCTYYVILATNNTGSDIRVSADFTALDAEGNVLRKVNDYSDAVKKGQQFILYGQFNNKVAVMAADYIFEFTVSETDRCAYTAVAIDTKDMDNAIEVSATNMMGRDIQCVDVRTVFIKNGRAVAFDKVNIADAGTTFHGGSTNSQMIGMFAGDYDNFIMTYTTAADTNAGEDI